MKILSPSQLNQADSKTIECQDITSWELMERASLAALDNILKIIGKDLSITILAGSGNNGGDGLAIAYHLDKKGFDVDVILLNYSSTLSKDCKTNLQRIEQETEVKILKTNTLSNGSKISFHPIIVDAVFGIGLNRELPGFVQESIELANQTNSIKIAIDVPSGLYLSEFTPKSSVVFKADYTLTFQCPKLNFFLPDFGNYLGKIEIIDIGLEQGFISKLKTEYEFVDHAYANKLLKKRERFSHKGTYGHLFVIGGQKGMMGSICLTTKAALRSGAGKVTALVPKSGLNIIQTLVPEAMTITSNNRNTVTPIKFSFKANHICIGMGLGTSNAALDILKDSIEKSTSAMLIDADGLNLISKHGELLEKLPSKSILTPHQGELKKLIGDWDNQYDKLEKMKSFVKKYDIILVSKDAYTFVVCKDKIYINSSGNPGMATAGSGDVLSGLISGFLTQDYSSIDSAILGVYLHGLAGDIYTKKYDENSLIASDIIECLKSAFSKF